MRVPLTGSRFTPPDQPGSSELERSVVSKVLVRLAPFLALLYVFNMLDRGNVSIAALTMQEDLKFSDTVYGLGAGIFFVGYFFLEVPSNLIMERVGARRWIARIMISWGVVSASTMFVHSPLSFYTLRFLLGVAEAGFYPGIILYLTYWVPGNARAKVIARFLSLTAILGLFGGPLGGQLLRLNGAFGLTGWQWLFLLEGIPSVILGLVVLGVMPNGPSEVSWLNADEKGWLLSQLEREARDEQSIKHISVRVLVSHPRIVLMCLIFILTSTAGNAIGFFGPQLIKNRSGGLWSDPLVATVLVIPAIVGAIAMVVAAAHSDRTGKRRRHVSLGYAVAGLGFLVCVYAPTAQWTLVALALNALGERSAAGSYWALTSSLMGARAAAGGIAFINSVGNLGGFIGPALMGKLKTWTHGGYAAGLYTAAGLMFLAALLANLLSAPSSAQSEAPPEMTDGTAASAQPEQHIP